MGPGIFNKMSDLNLKIQLQNLRVLQEVDSVIHSLRKEKELLPQEMSVFEAAFEEKKQQLQSAEKKSLELQKLRKERELELATKEEAAKKLQGQLFSLKTNKDYQTMLQQIQDAKADASVIEDKILEVLSQLDKTKDEVTAEKAKLADEEKVFFVKKKNIEDKIKEIDDRLKQLDVKRDQAIVGVDQKILTQYERVLHSRDGLALASVNNDSCGGCNMRTPKQVINLIKMYDRIITCEMCNRILYIEEDAGV